MIQSQPFISTIFSVIEGENVKTEKEVELWEIRCGTKRRWILERLLATNEKNKRQGWKSRAVKVWMYCTVHDRRMNATGKICEMKTCTEQIQGWLMKIASSYLRSQFKLLCPFLNNFTRLYDIFFNTESNDKLFYSKTNFTDEKFLV